MDASLIPKKADVILKRAYGVGLTFEFCIFNADSCIGQKHFFSKLTAMTMPQKIYPGANYRKHYPKAYLRGGGKLTEKPGTSLRAVFDVPVPLHSLTQSYGKKSKLCFKHRFLSFFMSDALNLHNHLKCIFLPIHT